MRCANNLKQRGVALNNYAGVHNLFPPSEVVVFVGNSPISHNWMTVLLPFLEKENIFKLYNTKLAWDDPGNSAATCTRINEFLCPSTPESPDRKFDGTTNSIYAAVSDYAAASGVSRAAIQRIFSITIVNGWRGVITRESPNDNLNPFKGHSIHQIGETSNTLLVIEDAGRPAHYLTGKSKANITYPFDDGCGNANIPASGIVPGAAWAFRGQDAPLQSFEKDGLTCPGLCVMNCTNNNEAYAFHQGGINSVFVDGSVRFINEKIQPRTYPILIIVNKEGYMIDDPNY